MKGMITCPHCTFSEDIEKFGYCYEGTPLEKTYICPSCDNMFTVDPMKRVAGMSHCESCGRHIPKNASHWRGPFILCFTCVVPFDIVYNEKNNHIIEKREE
jgi:transposase-like protein